jgi:hypothetical protein
MSLPKAIRHYMFILVLLLPTIVFLGQSGAKDLEVFFLAFFAVPFLSLVVATWGMLFLVSMDKYFLKDEDIAFKYGVKNLLFMGVCVLFFSQLEHSSTLVTTIFWIYSWLVLGIVVRYSFPDYFKKLVNNCT